MQIEVNRDSLGGRIEATRKARGMTQSELAGRIFGDEKKRDLVKHWEIGDRQIKTDHLAMLCKALDVSADFLIGRSEDPTADAEMKAICDYIGLSASTIAWLHNQGDPSIRSFYRTFFDRIIQNGESGLDDIPETIQWAAQAHVAGLQLPLRRSEDSLPPVTISENGTDFIVDALVAEQFFLSEAQKEINIWLRDIILDMQVEAIREIKATGEIDEDFTWKIKNSEIRRRNAREEADYAEKE